MNRLFWIILAALIVGTNALTAFFVYQKGQSTAFDHYKSVGSQLQSAGLKSQAAHYYQDYLRHADISPDKYAAIALATAKLLMESQAYPEALGLLYEVEYLAPQSAAAKESGKLIVQCLEKTGHGKAARTALKSRVSLTSTPEKSAGTVVASAGDLKVYAADFERQFQSLPPGIQAMAATPDGQKQLLHQALGNQALFEKAKARGLHESDDLQARLDAMAQDLAVAALIDDVVDKTPPSDAVLEALYTQHQASFGDQKLETVLPQLRQIYLSQLIGKTAQDLSAEILQNRKIDVYPQRVGVFTQHKTPDLGGTP